MAAWSLGFFGAPAMEEGWEGERGRVWGKGGGSGRVVSPTSGSVEDKRARPSVRALSILTQTRPKFGLGMRPRRTKKRTFVRFLPRVGPRFVSAYPKRTWPDHLGSCVGVGRRLLKLEAIACREAIALAEDLNIQHFVIAKVIDDINKGSQGNYGAIISEIRLQAVLFQHNFTFKQFYFNVILLSKIVLLIQMHIV